MATRLGRPHRLVQSQLSLPVSLNLSSALIGLQGFFPLKGQAAAGVGSVEMPPSERKRLAQLYVSTFIAYDTLTIVAVGQGNGFARTANSQI